MKSSLVIVVRGALHYRVLCTLQHYLIHSLQQPERQELYIVFASQERKWCCEQGAEWPRSQSERGATMPGFTNGQPDPRAWVLSLSSLPSVGECGAPSQSPDRLVPAVAVPAHQHLSAASNQAQLRPLARRATPLHLYTMRSRCRSSRPQQISAA